MNPSPFYSKCSAITLEIKTPFLVWATPKSSIYCLINSSSSLSLRNAPSQIHLNFYFHTDRFKVRVPSSRHVINLFLRERTLLSPIILEFLKPSVTLPDKYQFKGVKQYSFRKQDNDIHWSGHERSQPFKDLYKNIHHSKQLAWSKKMNESLKRTFKPLSRYIC